jgi:hypothetical protein
MYTDRMELHSKTRTGRGAVRDLPNRFQMLALDLDPDVVQHDPAMEGEALPNPKTTFLDDQSDSIIVRNDRLRTWLRLLLRAALPRVPRLFRGPRIRDENHGQAAGRRAVAARALAAQV